ncbi:hypothetical protein GWK47_005309 [Chionoecetes opilio]|uniref:Uncharacterized protein n=1 Tax=Chionoecetes opilio TaxID=41210 RepID=A0A8J4YGZ3_CHIOP|nr:hypothetical protein GWK47_005309 [Chionoecetes opilio]
MADVDIDLYGDVEQDFTQDDFADGDLYDAVLTGGGRDRERDAPPSPSQPPSERNGGSAPPRQSSQSQRSRSVSSEERAVFSGPVAHSGRKYQLYIGNLTWVSPPDLGLKVFLCPDGLSVIRLRCQYNINMPCMQ